MHPASKSNAVTVEELDFRPATEPTGTPADDRRERFAGNDDLCADPEPSAWPLSYALYHGARRGRAAALRAIFACALRAARASLEQARARYRQHRDARAIREALDRLDARSLRDLGFERSEIGSVAAEATGRAECTRIRIHQMLYVR